MRITRIPSERRTASNGTRSIAGTPVALFLVGLGVSRLTHRHPVRSGLRQAALGLLAAEVTFGVGTLLGTAVR